MSTPRQLTLDLVKPARPSLDNFVVGRNAEAVAALRAVADGSGEHFVYLWGETGAGRSHLLRALGLRPSDGIQFFDAQIPLFLVDDVDGCSESQQQRLFVLLNEIRAVSTARFVGAGSTAPMQLPLRDDVRTRLASGLVYQIHALSDEEKALALSAHAASRGLALPAEVIDYLLTHMPRDMRTLVAVVDALDTYALSVKKQLTVALVRQWADTAL
ncbi:MAG TPA: DnaA regulatory inactivator Hda [Burkholderiaceae bacterium]|nr:DnaA regulatory inactivator Hda [Burkholderiaceae bacterium]